MWVPNSNNRGLSSDPFVMSRNAYKHIMSLIMMTEQTIATACHRESWPGAKLPQSLAGVCKSLHFERDFIKFECQTQTTTGLLLYLLRRGFRTRFVKPSQTWPHNKQKRIPTTNMATPVMIMAGTFIKQPVMNIVIPPKRINPGNRTIPSVLQTVWHCGAVKQSKSLKRYPVWFSPPLTLQIGVQLESSSIVFAQFLVEVN